MKLKTLTLLFVIVGLFFSSASAQDLTWEPKSGIPEYGLNAASIFSIDNKIYVVNGLFPSGTYTKSLWQYDPATNIWTKKSSYPGSGSTLNVAFAINGKGYVGIGGSPSARHIDFYEYNPTTDTWSQKANFPGGARYAAGTFVIGDTAYLVGGSCGSFSCYKNDLWMYVPSTNTWTQKANFPGGNVAGPSTFSIGQFGYAGGGVSSSSALSNSYYKYSPVSDSWSSITSMPGTERRSAFAFVMGDKAYLTTGAFSYTNPTLQNDGYMYNSSSNSWSHFDCNSDFIRRYVSIAVAINDSTVFAGFGVDQNGYFLSDFWKLKLNYNPCDYYDTTFVSTSVQDTLVFELNTSSIASPSWVGVKVYPNPAGSEFRIDIEDQSKLNNYTLTISTSVGQQVYSQIINASYYIVNTNTIGGSGTYFIDLYDSNSNKKAHKILIIN